MAQTVEQQVLAFAEKAGRLKPTGGRHHRWMHDRRSLPVRCRGDIRRMAAPGRRRMMFRAGGQVALRYLRRAVSRAVSPTGTVVATAVFDAFGVMRHGTGALVFGVALPGEGP